MRHATHPVILLGAAIVALACTPGAPSDTDSAASSSTTLASTTTGTTTISTTAPTDTGTDPTGGAPAGPPNFVFFLGEARGWTSTSVLEDDAVPTSRSPIFLTPSLEQIAAEGMTFADFYAPSPRCMPSRASYFTGKSPARLHMTFVGEGASDGVPTGDVVPPDPLTTLPTTHLTIAALLKDTGYATAHFGKWHAGNLDPAEYGFDESDGPTTNKGPMGEDHPNPVQAYATATRGIDFMTRQVDAGAPFYLQISHYGGNDPIDATPESYAAESERLAGEDPKDIAVAAVVRDMDITIQQVLDTIDALGIADNTYVFFSADHGAAGSNSNAPLREGKGSTWEGGIRVPLLIRGPGVLKGGRSRVRATQVDLYPTIAALAGVAGTLPDDLEGGDLWTVLSTGSGAVLRAFEAFVVHFPHYDKDPLGPSSAILLGDYKLVRYYEDGVQQLHNVAEDLAEQTDLAAQMPDKVAELAKRMDDYLAAVGAQLPGHL